MAVGKGNFLSNFSEKLARDELFERKLKIRIKANDSYDIYDSAMKEVGIVTESCNKFLEKEEIVAWNADLIEWEKEFFVKEPDNSDN